MAGDRQRDKEIHGMEKDCSRFLGKEQALRRVALALDQMQNGEITIKVQGGKPIWVDKFERERVG